MNGLSYHGRVPLAQLEVAPGSSIIDVGCGWGDTAIELARKTGPTGSVLGLDCVEQFLVTARGEAEAASVASAPGSRPRCARRSPPTRPTRAS